MIFVRTPELVEEVRKSLVKSEKSRETKIAMLTGTMRGLERDELVKPPDSTDEGQHARRVMQRFLHPENDNSQGECFLISTSAGEVGFDLNADHMVCDAPPLDSMIQRLGRVNRRGKGKAVVHLVVCDHPDNKTEMDKACNAAADLFSDGADVSPSGLAKFKKGLSNKQIEAASTPVPEMEELTDILLDSWSMTSIVERMPGRPEVGPWIRGIADELPRTMIAWRAELDLAGFERLDPEDIEEWFDTHPVRTHESLSVPTSVAAKWLTDRWGALTDGERALLGQRSILVDRAGLNLINVKVLIDQLSRKNTVSISDAELVVPASFGGIKRGDGLLDYAVPPSATVDLVDLGEAEHTSEIEICGVDVADLRDGDSRFREVVAYDQDGKETNRRKLALSKTKGSKAHSCFRLELDSGEDGRTQLVSYVPKRDKLEWGTTPQSLEEHVCLVLKRMGETLERIGLSAPLRAAAELAAQYHDHGKNRDRWQHAAGGTATISGSSWSEATLGKSGGRMKRDNRGYRHEFGSLREFIDAHATGSVASLNGGQQDTMDLALHMIATHHGRGRPHFPKGGFDPEAESRSTEIAAEVTRRFARLQRKYGWWQLAWLENLLRCADALASEVEAKPSASRRGGGRA